MKIVIDNNIILDALIPNADFEKQAQEVLRVAFEKTIKGFINTNSVSDIFYVLRKKYGTDITKAMLRKLIQNLNVIGVEPIDSITALNSHINDFEDAIVDECAKKINADYIVSRDEKFINAQTKVEVISPNQLLSLLG